MNVATSVKNMPATSGIKKLFVLSIPAGPKRQHFSVTCTQSATQPNLVAMQSKKISEQSADDMLYFAHQKFDAPDLEEGLKLIKAHLIKTSLIRKSL